MRLLVGITVNEPNSFNWTMPNEPVYMFFLNGYKKETSFMGAFTGKSTTHAISKDIDITVEQLFNGMQNWLIKAGWGDDPEFVMRTMTKMQYMGQKYQDGIVIRKNGVTKYK